MTTYTAIDTTLLLVGRAQIRAVRYANLTSEQDHDYFQRGRLRKKTDRALIQTFT